MVNKKYTRSTFFIFLLAVFAFFATSWNPVMASNPSNPTCPSGPQVSCNSGLWSIGNGYTINGFSGQGKVRLWSDMGGGQRVQITKNGVVIQNVYPVNGIGAEIDVVASDTLSFHMYDCYGGNCSYPDYGWERENTGAYANTCGTGCPCPDKSWDGNYGISGSTQPFKSMVQNGDNGDPIGPMQCWGDWAENAWDKDMNDFKMWYTFEATCTCTPVTCPIGDPYSKFMRRTIPQGTGVACNACVPSTVTCDPLFRNTAPSCSFLPASVSMTREENPRQISLTTTDMDYGDEVSVTSVKVVDGSNALKSCVKTSITGGGALEGAVVKNDGGNNSGATSQLTNVFLDARDAHGIFTNVGGQSVCSGFLEIKIADKDSDGAGVDISEEATCRIGVTVTNQAPQLTNVTLLDKDVMDVVRDKGASNSGNLIDGRAQLFVGSSLSTQTKVRASYCSEKLTIDDPVKCRGGDEVYETSLSQRRNPLQLEFTVQDANGSDDLLQAGVWIQRVAQGKDSVALPLVTSGARNSFQALYSEKEKMQVAAGLNRWDFISRACLVPNCGPLEISTSTKQLFSGLAFINNLGVFEGINGNSKEGKTKSASQRAWQEVSFPDCISSGSGCSNANVPLVAQSLATADSMDLSNYDWAIGADSTHLLCFPSDSQVPTVIAASVPVSCPTSCAACLKKEGVTAVVGNPNALTFKFGVYFNGKDSGQGMVDGEYAIFLSALDKVSAPLNNVTGKGDEGWVKFNKSGAICAGATCPSNSDFSLLFDSTAPTVSYLSWTIPSTSRADANFMLSDPNGGSGIAGVTNRFMVKFDTLDGEQLGDRAWATRVSDNLDFDGKADHLISTNSSITLNGTGLNPNGGEEIVAGLCAYDRAGNMRCGRNPLQYVFLAPWLKTSYGDIYSSKGGAVPFSQTLPTDDGNTVDNTRNAYAPLIEQSFTVGTGLLLTGGAAAQGIGVSGGHIEATINRQLGFMDNYRTGDISSFNVYGHIPFSPANEFERLRATAILNCDLMTAAVAGSCQSSGSVATVGSSPYNILYLSNVGTIPGFVCKHTNVLFVTGVLNITGNVIKDTAFTDSGCMFVLATGASLQISDIPSNEPRAPAGDGKGQPTIDRIDAAIVANAGATIQALKGARGATTKSTDRLEIKGWVYSASTLPQFKRDLAPVDNRRYPAEYIIYDATLLDLFRPLLGTEKTVDLSCGTSAHVLCQTTN